MAHLKHLDDVDPAVAVKIDGIVLPKFGSVPYETVMQKFESYCKFKDLLIPNSNPRPARGNQGYHSWQEWVYPKEYRAVALLQNLCQEGDLSLIDGLDTVKEVKNILRQRYKGDLTAQFFTASDRWQTLKLGADETISSYFSRARLLAAELKDLEQPVSEPAQVTQLMKGLPQEYELAVTLFRSKYKDPRDIELLPFQDCMQQHENQLSRGKTFGSGGGQEKALQAKESKHHEDADQQKYKKHPYRPPKRPHGPKKPSTKRAGDRQRRQQHEPKRINGTCYGCGRKGHMRKDCRWNPPPSQDSRPREASSYPGRSHNSMGGQPNFRPQHPNARPQHRVRFAQDTPGPSQASFGNGGDYGSYYDQDFAPTSRPTANPARAYRVLEADRAHYSGVVKSNITSSILDSGSSHHMTPVKELLVNYKPLDPCPVIYVGNGVPCKVLGTGSLFVRANNSYGTRDVQITDVWYVPELIDTLISVNQLEERGVKGLIGDKCIAMIDSSYKELFTAYYRPGQGYVPDWSFIGPAANAVAFYARETKQDALLWHARLGHCSMDVLSKMVKGDHATGINVPHNEFHKHKDDVCPICVQSKLQRMPYRSDTDKSTVDVCEIICSDVTGPYQVRSLGGAWYMLILVDYGTSRWASVPIVEKSDAAPIVQEYIERWETESGKHCKIFQTDNGGEYLAGLLEKYLARKGIKHYTSLPYEHQQNGIAENAIKHCNNLARALLYQSGLPLSLWGEAVAHAAYLHNVTYCKALGMSPHEAFHGQTPNLSQLRTFGCLTYFRVPDELRKKLDPKANVGYYVGKAANSKAVRILVKHPKTGRLSIKLGRDIVTVERYLTHPNVPATQYYKRTNVEDPQGLLESWNEWPVFDGPSTAEPFQRPPMIADLQATNDLNYKLRYLLADEQPGREDLPDQQVVVRHGDPSREAAADLGSSGLAPAGEVTEQLSDDLELPPLVEEPFDTVESQDAGGEQCYPDKDSSLEGEGFSDYTGHSSLPPTGGSRYPTRLRKQPDRFTPQAKRVRLDAHHAYAAYARGATSTLFDAIAHAAVIEVDGFEPCTFHEAMNCPEWPMWKEALDSEFNSLMENNTWTLVERKPGMKVIPSKWVFKIKRDADGNISRYKCRLVAGGHRQKFGVDYDETFAPVSKATTLRVLLSVAAFRKWSVHQLDIKTAFLHGDVDVEVYMEQPEGYEEGVNLVCLLTKCLYGLKQAPRAWFAKLTEHLSSLGFESSVADPSLWVGRPYGKWIYISLVVDDTLITGEDESHIKQVISEILNRFEGHASKAEWYVGMKLNWQPDGTVILTQKRHIEKLITEHFPNEKITPRTTPAHAGFKFSKKKSF
jgi:hypothetical protein